MLLKNKVAIVTGSSRGIGKATAIALAKEGAKVVVNYFKSEDKAKEVVKEIEKLGSSVIAVKADVANIKDVEKLVNETISKFKRIDILVNNAGIFIYTPLDEISEDDWNKTLDTNLKSQLLLSKAVEPYMKKQGGSIINISSTFGGLEAAIGCSAYNVSKAGVIALTKVLALELAPEIRVNAILPGIIDTDLTTADTEENKKRYLARTPLKRFGKPIDIAKAVIFFASHDFITGQTLVVDGGMTTCRFYDNK